jgi:MFS family permease
MYGAKWIFGGSIFFSAVLDFLVPIAAKSGVISLVLIRATQGAFQGPSYPALYAMAAKWLPVQEKNRLLAIICVGTISALNVNIQVYNIFVALPLILGAQMGTMSGMVLSGFITEAFGWEATFYFVGGAGTLWFLGWVFLAFNSPAVHPRISKVSWTLTNCNA